MSWSTGTLWDFLKDKTRRGIFWKKEKRFGTNQYVGYDGSKEIGFIPISYPKSDVEWDNWWQQAYKRFDGGLCLNDLLDEITDRYESRKGKL